jgi:hypothetical protein
MTFRFKRTPEQEAYRLQRLREALAKPRSKEWKERQGAGIRKAYAEGRMPARTRESIERGAAKLRGRQRPREIVEKIRAKNLGIKRTPAQCQAQSERVRRGLAEGKYRLTDPAAIARRNAKIGQANKGHVVSLEQRREHSRKMRNRKQPAEFVEKRAAPLRGRPQRALLTKKGPTHWGAMIGAVRSPENIVYEFRNLTHFVREHPHLFNPDDVMWRKRGSNETCRAAKGLINLFGKGKVVNGSWKGWTRYSRVEQDYNVGEDLLLRPYDIGTQIKALEHVSAMR